MNMAQDEEVLFLANTIRVNTTRQTRLYFFHSKARPDMGRNAFSLT